MPDTLYILNVYVSPDRIYQTTDGLLFSKRVEQGKTVVYVAFYDFNMTGTGDQRLVIVKATKVTKVEPIWCTYLDGVDHKIKKTEDI